MNISSNTFENIAAESNPGQLAAPQTAATEDIRKPAKNRIIIVIEDGRVVKYLQTTVPK